MATTSRNWRQTPVWQFGPSDRWYEPPEPVICCALAEDDPDHDSEQCRADSAEAAAEERAERQREEMMESRYADW